MNVVPDVFMGLNHNFDEMATRNSAFFCITTSTSYFSSSNSQLIVVDKPGVRLFDKFHGKAVNIIFEQGDKDSLTESMTKQF